MQHKMLYLLANANHIPFGHITSTARKGRKWFDLATAGDTLAFFFTESGEFFGRAAVVKVELVTFRDVIDRALENHASEGGFTITQAQNLLMTGLQDAYGPCDPDEEFTMVHFIRLNSANRDSAYVAIDSERDYQDALKAASPSYSGGHEVPAYLVFMEDYLAEARRITSRDWSPECVRKTLNKVRCVVALGVACMEEHGAPLRTIPDAEKIADRVAPIR